MNNNAYCPERNLEAFHCWTTSNTKTLPALVFQLEVHYKVGRLPTGLHIQIIHLRQEIIYKQINVKGPF